MVRGRPTVSVIRNHLIDILTIAHELTGYDLHKIYCKIYPACTLRVVYYHLAKGVELGLFRVNGTRVVSGDYSWGVTSSKTYYVIGSAASPSSAVSDAGFVEQVHAAKNALRSTSH